jgi:hypothetical protein
MSVTLTTTARNAACDALVDLLDTGSGDAEGDLTFATSGAALNLCTCAFSNPAFGASATGVATANAIGQGVVAGSSNPSTIAVALFRNRANTEMWRCAVGISGSDINLEAVAVNNGDTIDITDLTFTVPAS